MRADLAVQNALIKEHSEKMCNIQKGGLETIKAVEMQLWGINLGIVLSVSSAIVSIFALVIGMIAYAKTR